MGKKGRYVQATERGCAQMPPPSPAGRKCGSRPTDGCGQRAEDQAVCVLEEAHPLEALGQPAVGQACTGRGGPGAWQRLLGTGTMFSCPGL